MIETNSGNWNSGDRNSGDRNSGDRNSGNWNSGNRNSGYCNSGDRNSGNWNSGYCNSGDRNSGNRNSGYCNSGDRNSGDRNSGDWNSGNRNSGYCNSATPNNILVFNKNCEQSKWDNSKKPNWMFFPTAEWIEEVDMSGKEKEAYPSYTTTGGYLKVYTSYKHAAISSWEKAPQEDKELTLQLPNFDDEVFKEIFGFSALESLKKEEKIEVSFGDEKFKISKESFEEFKRQFKKKEV